MDLKFSFFLVLFIINISFLHSQIGVRYSFEHKIDNDIYNELDRVISPYNKIYTKVEEPMTIVGILELNNDSTMVSCKYVFSVGDGYNKFYFNHVSNLLNEFDFEVSSDLKDEIFIEKWIIMISIHPSLYIKTPEVDIFSNYYSDESTRNIIRQFRNDYSSILLPPIKAGLNTYRN